MTDFPKNAEVTKTTHARTAASSSTENRGLSSSLPESADQQTDDTPRQTSERAPSEQAERPDPTRYGDWEKNGRCIDF